MAPPAPKATPVAETVDPAPEAEDLSAPGGEVPPEPPEAQPPAGISLDEPELADVIDADVVAEPVEATEGEVAALLSALDLDQIADEAILSPPPRERWEPFVGASVRYVTARADLDGFGPAHAPGDVCPAVVVGHADGHVDVRVFIRGEGVPYRAGVRLILDPGEVTLDHQGLAFCPTFRAEAP